MKIYAFCDAVYKHFGTRSIDNMLRKCKEVLDTIQMGFMIRGFDGKIIKEFMALTAEKASVLKQQITRQLVQNYLQTKEFRSIPNDSSPSTREKIIYMDISKK